MKGLAVGEVKKGKVEEFISRLATHYQEFALEIEGFKHQIETFFDVAEAYKILGIETTPE